MRSLSALNGKRACRDKEKRLLEAEHVEGAVKKKECEQDRALMMTRCPFRLQIIGIFFFPPLFRPFLLPDRCGFTEGTQAISDKIHKSRHTIGFSFRLRVLSPSVPFVCVSALRLLPCPRLI